MQLVVSSAVGSENIGQTVEALQRFPINLRYPRELRDSLASIRRLPIVTPRAQLAAARRLVGIRITDGALMLHSEVARLAGLSVRQRSRCSRIKPNLIADK